MVKIVYEILDQICDLIVCEAVVAGQRHVDLDEQHARTVTGSKVAISRPVPAGGHRIAWLMPADPQ